MKALAQKRARYSGKWAQRNEETLVGGGILNKMPSVVSRSVRRITAPRACEDRELDDERRGGCALSTGVDSSDETKAGIDELVFVSSLLLLLSLVLFVFGSCVVFPGNGTGSGMTTGGEVDEEARGSGESEATN